MTSQSILGILHSLAATGSLVPDGELLRQFLANDERAFAELVRRHGRLVWAVCRHLTRSDAEADDAFQATFLVLLKNAKRVRDPGKLSAWLHGVAYKVCAKTRQAAQRRQSREQAMAAREGNGSAVPDSAWDRALAAVHEEVAKLPETLRVPFVLCCLEGIGVSEAAAQLGWKLGTLSGRLTRAKDAVLVKLEARGMTLGIVATVGVVSLPTAVVAKATALAQIGFTVPISIVQLSQGVIGMSMKSVKMLAAAVMLTCGLGLSVGTGWVGEAGAQGEGKPDNAAKVKKLEEELKAARLRLPKMVIDPNAEVKRLQMELDQAKAATEQEARRPEVYSAYIQEALRSIRPNNEQLKTAKWEYDLVDILETFDKAKFASFLQERENQGWEFLGSTTLGKSGGVFQWLFRRAVKGTRETLTREMLKSLEVTPQIESTRRFLGEEHLNPPLMESANRHFFEERLDPLKVDYAKSIEVEINKLQEKLRRLNEKKTSAVTFNAGDLPLAEVDFAPFLAKLAEKKFAFGRVNIIIVGTNIQVHGDKEVCDWATGVVKSLMGSSSQGAGKPSGNRSSGDGGGAALRGK